MIYRFIRNLTVSDDCPIQKFSDKINSLSNGSIQPKWTKNDDGTFAVKIDGNSDQDRNTVNLIEWWMDAFDYFMVWPNE